MTNTKHNEEIKKLKELLASIEYGIAQNEITKYQALTKMKQIVCSLTKENERINKDRKELIIKLIEIVAASVEGIR